MPIDYSDYADNWLTEIRPAVLRRAKNACENCRVPNYGVVKWNSQKRRYVLHKAKVAKTFIVAQKRCNRLNMLLEAALPRLKFEKGKTGRKLYRKTKVWMVIKLAIAHLDHNTQNNDLDNLKALCQRCHLGHDRLDNSSRRKYGKHYKEGQLAIGFRKHKALPRSSPFLKHKCPDFSKNSILQALRSSTFMTKKEAIAEINNGSKLTHRLFTPNEFIWKQNGRLMDEAGLHMHDFWYYRKGREWDKDWSVYQPAKTL